MGCWVPLGKLDPASMHCSRRGCTSRFRYQNCPIARCVMCVARKCPCYGCPRRIADLWSFFVGRFAPLLQAVAKSSRPENRKLQGASAHHIQVTQSGTWITGKDSSRFHVNRMRGWTDFPFRACTNRRRLRRLPTPGTLAVKNEKLQNASFPPVKHTHGCAWSRRA